MKDKIKLLLKNDIFWIFFISVMAGVFGRLSNIYDSELFEAIGASLVVIGFAYFFAWCIISIFKQRK